jgi:DNA-directed RNA polymerase subunit RPC12/RpoP
MKAIICTQCGATIENVSETSVIIHCEYCGARLWVDPVLKPPAPPIEPPEIYSEQPSTSLSPVKIAILVMAASVLIPLLIGVFALKRPADKYAFVTNVNRNALTPVPYSAPSPLRLSTEPAKPVPVVNYQPRVAWDGPNDMEHFEEPEVDISSVADLTAEEVEKTVFKNRVVKLRVVINTEGEIDSVETVSGHPIWWRLRPLRLNDRYSDRGRNLRRGS